MPLTPKRAEELLARTLDFKALLDELNTDLTKAAIAARDTNDPFHRRSYVRAVFAYVEGTLSGTDKFFLDSASLGAAEAMGWALPPATLQVLSDHLQVPRVDGKRTRFLNVEPHIKMIVKLGTALFGDLAMRFDGREWTEFQEALDLRNRVVHPKAFTDLALTDDEMRLTDRARDWYRFGMQRMFVKALDDYRALALRLRSRASAR